MLAAAAPSRRLHIYYIDTVLGFKLKTSGFGSRVPSPLDHGFFLQRNLVKCAKGSSARHGKRGHSYLLRKLIITKFYCILLKHTDMVMTKKEEQI